MSTEVERMNALSVHGYVLNHESKHLGMSYYYFFVIFVEKVYKAQDK